jgi:hypothetical protein
MLINKRAAREARFSPACDETSTAITWEEYERAGDAAMEDLGEEEYNAAAAAQNILLGITNDPGAMIIFETVLRFRGVEAAYAYMNFYLHTYPQLRDEIDFIRQKLAGEHSQIFKNFMSKVDSKLPCNFVVDPDVMQEIAGLRQETPLTDWWRDVRNIVEQQIAFPTTMADDGWGDQDRVQVNGGLLTREQQMQIMELLQENPELYWNTIAMTQLSSPKMAQRFGW